MFWLHPDHGGRRTFVVPEEKRTDVSIAIHMLDDAYRGLCECQVLVSGDDLVPAIQMVRQRFPELRTTVYVRQERGTEAPLSSSERPPTVTERSRWIYCRNTQLRVSRMSGGFVEKPAEW